MRYNALRMLSGPQDGLLGTPAPRMQCRSEGAEVVVHPELALDQLGDSAQRPALGLERGRLGATPEETEEVVPLGGGQPRGPAGGMALAQSAHPSLLEAVLPARHRRPGFARVPRGTRFVDRLLTDSNGPAV